MIDVKSQGTPPFMAISLLRNGAEGVLHEAKHDLESLLYVMLFCGTMLKGPHGTWRVAVDFQSYSSIPMQEWFSPDAMETSYAHMGRTKLSHMEDFQRAIIQRMDRYFSPLFTGFQAIRDAAFPTKKGSYFDCQLQHEPMIKILNDVLAHLPEEHTKLEPDPKLAPAEPGMQGVKRKRAGEFHTKLGKLNAN